MSHVRGRRRTVFGRHRRFETERYAIGVIQRGDRAARMLNEVGTAIYDDEAVPV
jgi:hypothetical protein